MSGGYNVSYRDKSSDARKRQNQYSKPECSPQDSWLFCSWLANQEKQSGLPQKLSFLTLTFLKEDSLNQFYLLEFFIGYTDYSFLAWVLQSVIELSWNDCLVSSLFQPIASCVLCHLLCCSRSCPSDLGGESTHRSPGRLQHFPVYLLLYTTEENQHCQHMGRSCCWGYPTCHGLDSGDWQPRCW